MMTMNRFDARGKVLEKAMASMGGQPLQSTAAERQVMEEALAAGMFHDVTLEELSNPAWDRIWAEHERRELRAAKNVEEVEDVEDVNDEA